MSTHCEATPARGAVHGASTDVSDHWPLADISAASAADPEENDHGSRDVAPADLPRPGDITASGWRTAPPRRQVAPPRSVPPEGQHPMPARDRRRAGDDQLPPVWHLYTDTPLNERDWWYHDDGFYCLPYVSGQEVPWVRPYHTSELRHQLEVELAHAKRLSSHVMTISHRWLRLVLYYTVRSVDLTRRNSRI